MSSLDKPMLEKSRKRGYNTPVPVKGTGCDEMNMLWLNHSIFSGFHDISCISTYSLTTFVKEVSWLEAPVKLGQNEHFVMK